MYLVGIDLGGTNLRLRCIHSGATDAEELIGEQRIPVGQRNAKELIEAIAATIEGWHDDKVPVSISFAVAGMLDPTGERILNAPNLGWRDVPLVTLLQQRLSLPHTTSLLNDLDAAAFGEYVAGAGRDASHMACVFVGSGVGCGLVLDGHLYTGTSRVAGEFGHMKVEVSSNAKGESLRRCGCGAEGCLEAYVGGHQLAEIARDAATHGRSAYLKGCMERYAQAAEDGSGGVPLSAADIEAGAADHDPFCLALWEQTARYLGVSLANLLTLLNLDALLLGGGVLGNAPLLREQTRREIQRWTNSPALSAVTISSPQLGDDAGLMGAIAWAKRH